MDWTTIESDPGVFTDLIRKIGVKNAQVEELYTLEDQEALQAIKPIYGLVFLFKWQEKKEPRQCLQYYDQDLYFANQMIRDACATYALLSILLNAKNLDIGNELTEFKAFTRDMDSTMRGEALSNHELIRQVHNSYTRPQSFLVEQPKNPEKPGDAFHFISYVPFKGKLYELDGLQQGPILIGEFEGEDGWLELARQEIGKRIEKYTQDEVRFNLMAICADRRVAARKNIQSIKKTKLGVYAQLTKDGQTLDNTNQAADYQALQGEMFDEGVQPQEVRAGLSAEQYIQQLEDLNVQLSLQQNVIEEENQKETKQSLENVRRKHDYTPFIIQLLKLAADKGKLAPLVERATKRMEERRQQREKHKKEKQEQNQK